MFAPAMVGVECFHLAVRDIDILTGYMAGSRRQVAHASEAE